MIILSLSYFLGKEDEWVPKEIAMVRMVQTTNSIKSQSYLFQPPYSDSELSPIAKRTNAWNERNRAHSKWGDGDIEYTLWKDLLYKFCLQDTEIYAKGLQQVEFFGKALPNMQVQDLESMGCPTAEQIAYDEGGGIVTCAVVRHGQYCPLNKCMQYLFWLQDRRQEQEDAQQQEDEQRAAAAAAAPVAAAAAAAAAGKSMTDCQALIRDLALGK
jgi:hypothetical protein